jgi:multiple antibiotic resistance protein
MVMGGHSRTAPKAAAASENIAVFPMAIPLMAGPGCATAFILLLDTAQEQSVNALYVIVAMILVEFLTLIGLVTATRIMALVGEGALGILARVTGISIAALAVQFILSALNIV